MSTLNTALAIIGGIVLVLQAVHSVPSAITALLRACEPVVRAYRNLRNLFQHNSNELPDRPNPGSDRRPKEDNGT